MANASEAIMTILETARGIRPYSLSNKETEQVFNIVLSLIVEVASSNDRIDNLERLLSVQTRMQLSEIEKGRSDAEAENERSQTMQAYLLRTLRILIDPRETIDARPKARNSDSLV